MFPKADLFLRFEVLKFWDKSRTIMCSNKHIVGQMFSRSNNNLELFNQVLVSITVNNSSLRRVDNFKTSNRKKTLWLSVEFCYTNEQ